MVGERDETANRARGSRRWWADLAFMSLFVLVFYAPFLDRGLPPGDFASTVAVTAIEDTMVQTPWSFPSWNPEVMCGRPYNGFMSPFIVFRLPFMGLDPIDAMKALMVFFHVLGAFSMYGLLRSLGLGRAASLFGGCVYPLLPSHVTRTGLHGHVQLPMLFAFLPVLFWGLFRLRRMDARGGVVLALLIAVGLMRDVQRVLLVLVMLGLVLLMAATAVVIKRVLLREGAWFGRAFQLGLALLVASVLAVAFDAVELVGAFSTDPYRGGWQGAEQSYWMSRWSLENLYSLFDWDARLGARFESLDLGIYPSVSRYVGLSLLGLALVGACLPRHLGRNCGRFWLVFALFPMSVWLSFGRSPIWGQLRDRWPALLASDDVGGGWRVVILVLPLLGLSLLVVGIARHLDWLNREASGRAARLTAHPVGRGLLASLLVAFLLYLFLCHAPLKALIEHVFFLRDFRNPDWFQVSVASFAVVLPASLGLEAIMAQLRSRGLGERRVLWSVMLVASGLALADFLPYRDILTKHQRSAEALAEFEQVHRAIGEDEGLFRVLAAERSNSNVDLGYIWHGAPLAWDFRTHTAPRRTQTFMARLHRLIESSPSSDEIGILCSLANVKYLVDERGYWPDLESSRTLVLQEETERLHAHRNRTWEGFVRAFPEVRLLVGDCGEAGANLAARLAGAGIALASSDGPPSPALLEACTEVYYSRGKTEPAFVPAGAIPFSRRVPALSSPRSFVVKPQLTWDRPAPERIHVSTRSGVGFFLQVSESYHPWWTVRIDGEDAEVSPAGHAFLGLPIPAGSHEVEFELRRPIVLPMLFLLSLLSTGLALGGLLWARRARRFEARGEPLSLWPQGVASAVDRRKR